MFCICFSISLIKRTVYVNTEQLCKWQTAAFEKNINLYENGVLNL